MQILRPQRSTKDINNTKILLGFRDDRLNFMQSMTMYSQTHFSHILTSGHGTLESGFQFDDLCEDLGSPNVTVEQCCSEA